jgi:flagellin
LLVAATSTVANVNNAKSKLGVALEKLATGSRINRAADDSAGLNMSTRQLTDQQSLEQAMNNINMGVSLLHTAEGGLDTMFDILVRMRELAVQSSNEVYNQDERDMINTEWAALAEGYDQIAGKTQYNGINLLDTAQSGFKATVTLQIGILNNTDSKFSLSLSSIAASSTDISIGAGDLEDTFTAGIASQSTATSSFDKLDKAMSEISNRRNVIGSYLNRLESSLNNTASDSENLTLTASRISDADYAAETANMTRNQIMFNASTVALGQASGMKASSITLIDS